MSGEKVFVGNLPFSVTEDDVAAMFEGLQVSNVKLVRDFETERFRGFGYVEFASSDDAQRALEKHGMEVGGRQIRVDVADRGSGGRDGNRGGGRDGGFGGGGFGGGDRGGDRGGFGGGDRGGDRGGFGGGDRGGFGGGRGGFGGGDRGGDRGGFGGDRGDFRAPRREAVADAAGGTDGGPSFGQGRGDVRVGMNRNAAQPVDRSQAEWWKVGRKPAPQAANDAQGLPIVRPVFTLDIPAGVDSLTFHVERIPGNLLPEECERDLTYGFAVCRVSPAPGQPKGIPEGALDMDLVEAVEPLFKTANEFGAGSTVCFTFGYSCYIVPKQLTTETFTPDELKKMLSSGFVRHVMIDEIPPSVPKGEITRAVNGDRAWEHKTTTIEIDATFQDRKIACLCMEDGGRIVGDQTAAAALAGVGGGDFVTGANLDARAALCTMGAGGRLVVPPVTTNDVRVAGSKQLDKQANRKVETYEHLSAYQSLVSTVADYDHSDRYQAPDSKHYEVTMFRRHLRPDTEGLDSPSGEEYCVFTNVFISIGRQVDFRLQVSEVAPAVIDGEPAIIPQCPVDDSTSVLLQGVKLARAIVAKLPAYEMFADTHVDPLEKARKEAENARLAIRQQRM